MSTTVSSSCPGVTQPRQPGTVATAVGYLFSQPAAVTLTRFSCGRSAAQLNPWQVLVMGVTVWLARWSQQTEEEQDRGRYVVALAVLTAGAVLVSLFRAILTFFSLVRVRKYDRTPFLFSQTLLCCVLCWHNTPRWRCCDDEVLSSPGFFGWGCVSIRRPSRRRLFPPCRSCCWCVRCMHEAIAGHDPPDCGTNDVAEPVGRPLAGLPFLFSPVKPRNTP